MNTGKYLKNYHPKGRYDILNNYYLLKESPEEIPENFMVELSRTMTTLFKAKDQQETGCTVDKINFAEYNDVPADQLARIRQFWYQIVVEFIKNYHPYCSFEGIVALAQFHIKQNHDIYYPKGKTNLTLYTEHNILSN